MKSITPTNTPQRPAKRQNTGSTHDSTPVRNNTTATAGVTTPVNQQQATQLTSPPKLKQQHKEYVALEDVISKAITLPDSPDRPLNDLQQRNRNTSNRVPDTQNP